MPNAPASSLITPPPLPIRVRPRRDFILGYLVAFGFGFAIALLMDNFIMDFPITVGLIVATHWELQKGKSPFHYASSGTIVVIGVFYARKWGWL